MPEPPAPQSWAIPAAIVVLIALIAVGGVVFALDQVESDAEREATEPTLVVGRPQPPANGKQPTEVASWPAGTDAYTVVLAETPEETTARAHATAALEGGVPAGVLHSDAYPTLEPGMWVLFAGRFDSRAEAAEEATRYAAAGFPEAEPAFVSDGGASDD